MSKSKILEFMIWVLYALGTGACLIFVGCAYSWEYGYGVVPGIVATVLLAAAVGLLAFGLHKFAQKESLRLFFANKKLILTIIESLIFVAMLIGMVLVRLDETWSIMYTEAYQAAQVTPQRFYIMQPHGGYRVYLYLLNFALRLFGSRTYAAVVLHLVLLCGAAISMYFGVRRLGGSVSALLATAVLGFSPYMIDETITLNCFLVFLICYGIGLNCIGGISYAMTQSKHILDQIAAVLCYIAIGAFIGFCCYLDLSGITLLVILTCVICFEDDVRLARESYWNPYGDETVPVGCLKAFERRFEEILRSPIVAFVSTVLVALFVFGKMHGNVSSLFDQVALYLPKAYGIPMSLKWTEGFGELVAILLMIVLGVFSFLFTKCMGNRMIWFFSALLLLVMLLFGIAAPDQYFNSYALLYILATVLAGCGLGDICAKKQEKQVVEETDKSGISDSETSNSETANAAISNADTGSAETAAEKVEEIKEEPLPKMQPLPNIQFIENPLPLPKKRERKVMDYDYEVADDDDFDIQ